MQRNRRRGQWMCTLSIDTTRNFDHGFRRERAERILIWHIEDLGFAAVFNDGFNQSQCRRRIMAAAALPQKLRFFDGVRVSIQTQELTLDFHYTLGTEL